MDCSRYSIYVAVFAIFLPIFYAFFLALAAQSEDVMKEIVEKKPKEVLRQCSFYYESIQKFLEISGEYFHLLGIFFLAQILKIICVVLVGENVPYVCVLVNFLSLIYIYAFYPNIRRYIPTYWQLTVILLCFYILPTTLWFVAFKLKNLSLDMDGSFGILVFTFIFWFGFYPVKYQPLTNLHKLKRALYES